MRLLLFNRFNSETRFCILDAQLSPRSIGSVVGCTDSLVSDRLDCLPFFSWRIKRLENRGHLHSIQKLFLVLLVISASLLRVNVLKLLVVLWRFYITVGHYAHDLLVVVKDWQPRQLLAFIQKRSELIDINLKQVIRVVHPGNSRCRLGFWLGSAAVA